MRKNGPLLGLLAVVAGLSVVNPAQAATPSAAPTIHGRFKIDKVG